MPPNHPECEAYAMFWPITNTKKAKAKMTTKITYAQDDAIRDLISAFREVKRQNLKIIAVHKMLFAAHADFDKSGMSLIDIDNHPETARLYGQLSE